ncbi:FlgD immunoglobulin-like domain containing protein [Candidatus Latescibacterota bacterium]
MKLLKSSLFTFALLMLTISVFAQNEDYWGEEVYYNSGVSRFTKAVYSPDGNWIACATCLGCSRPKIFVVPTEGGEPILVYENEAQMITDLCFTPDSKEITLSIYDFEDSTTPLVSVNIFTGELRMISDGETQIEGSNPDWSSDGRYLLYANGGTKILDTETGEIRTLGSDMLYVKFTQDNAYLMYINRDGRKLYRIPFEGGTPELIPVSGISSYYDISPDGNWILYYGVQSNSDDINAYNIQTGETVTLLYRNDKNRFNNPVFSPDGTQICYIRDNEARYLENSKQTTTPYVIDFDPTHDPGPPPSMIDPIASVYGTKVGVANVKSVSDFAISSDGQWIVYTYDINGQKIYIALLAGGEENLLYEMLYQEGNIKNLLNENFTFRPNSSELYFEHKFEDTTTDITEYNIECINIDSSEHRVVIEGAQYPSWSKDGRYLVYTNYDYRINTDPSAAVRNGVIAIYDSQTEEIRYLADGEENAWEFVEGIKEGICYFYPTISPDGSCILCNMNNYNTHEDYFVTFPFEGGEPEVLPLDEAGSYPNLKYSPNGNWILYYGNHLNIYNVETKEDFYVVDHDVDPRFFRMGGLMKIAQWSSDGSKIYYILEDLNDYNQIYVLDFDSDRYTKTVAVESETQKSFAVMSNYPNPFNPTTTIEFTLPEAGFTKLVVYNIMGQKIRELVSADMPAGVHSVIWDGRDQNGLQVSSGVFIARLTSGDNVVPNRLMLVK